MMPAFAIRPLSSDDDAWVRSMLTEHWGSPRIVTRGRVHHADELPGFITEVDRQLLGLVTYHTENDQCEIVSLNSLREGAGIGTALVEVVRDTAAAAGCRRLWLITTNDNLAAIRFYQRRGWRLVAVHRDALEQSRRLKPEIPLVGNDGIPLRDEIEMELLL
jgi:RimJ/RimL family protein N-acetyltransferase